MAVLAACPIDVNGPATSFSGGRGEAAWYGRTMHGDFSGNEDVLPAIASFGR